MDLFQRKSLEDEVQIRKFNLQKYQEDLKERRNTIMNQYKDLPIPNKEFKDKLDNKFDIFEEIQYQKEKYLYQLNKLIDKYSKFDLKTLEDIQEEELDENLNEYQYILMKLLRIDNDIQIDTYQIDLEIPKISEISRENLEEINKQENLLLPKDILKEFDHFLIKIMSEQKGDMLIRKFGMSEFELLLSSRLNSDQYNQKFWNHYSLISELLKRNESRYNTLLEFKEIINMQFGKNRFKEYMKKTSMSLSNFILFHYEKYRSCLTESILRKPEPEIGDYIFEQYHPESNKLESIKSNNMMYIYYNSQFNKFKKENRINSELLPDEITDYIGKLESGEEIEIESKNDEKDISKNYLFYLLKFQSSYFTDSIIKQIVIEYQRRKLLHYILKIGYYLKPDCIEMIEKNHIFGYSYSVDKKNRFLKHFNSIHYPSWDDRTIQQFEILIFDFVHKMTCKLPNRKLQLEQSLKFCEKEGEYLKLKRKQVLKYLKFIKINEILH